MTGSILRELDITNFRSIRGHVYAPLDAKVVLIHGENGAGKTSLLSAIELALTGSVQSLHRADAGYAKQLLHRSATSGSVLVKTSGEAGEQSFETRLDAGGATAVGKLEQRLAAFFSERAYLPQSLLGQLLQIYQESGSGADSPLARFVGKLLGLDRLDALEAGLKPLVDIRNVRKVVDGWSGAETEKTRLERLLEGQRNTRATVAESLAAEFERLKAIAVQIAPDLGADEAALDALTAALEDKTDETALEALLDQVRQLGAIKREIAQAQGSAQGAATLPDADGAAAAYQRWETGDGTRVSAMRIRVEQLLPQASLPGDLGRFPDEALVQLRAATKAVSDRAAQARVDSARRAAAQSERDTALEQRNTIDAEVGSISSDSGSLASALAELASFLNDEICPVCDRNFSEEGKGTLGEHVHAKVRRLSGSAERLLALGRSRSEVQLSVERLEREIEALTSRILDPKALADLDRRAADLDAAVTELEGLADAFREGGRLRGEDVVARRAVTEAQSRTAALLGARETLGTFARALGAAGPGEGETFEAAAGRLELRLMAENKRLGDRVTMRREGLERVASIRTALARRAEIDAGIGKDMAAWRRADSALTRSQALRDEGIAIRNAVDRVRSAIIRREFNDRLNFLWRDLFVRLAPSEPFVPAFRIPPSGTQRLQPKLITEHRYGGEAGGTPGAMLSAGNLNTAALTLFIALHLSVPKELPWLILDDPVQSMDDVHIAHFAALLRTLSKEHGRQVLIAVHDRQLFEYLRLELSPAFPEDSLLTLELSRSQRRDTLCSHERFSFKEETALLAAA
ncbi:AAA family ATPase [Sphingomonas cannabina]|uniref:AAA family ATPase n=1 Tax=Sphingomonas cannabina TaxID=2899123 RepID=UPI001F2705E7|nr:AAA family ATPase [Sphingomonas cannabina]UIJ47124.1 AAA family ATPase [Sphingomonas cannabina]